MKTTIAILAILGSLSSLANGLALEPRNVEDLATFPDSHRAIAAAMLDQPEDSITGYILPQPVAPTKRTAGEIFLSNQGKQLILGAASYVAGSLHLSNNIINAIAHGVSEGWPADAGGSAIVVGGIGVITWQFTPYGKARPFADTIGALTINSIVYDYLQDIKRTGAGISIALVELGIDAAPAIARSGYALSIALSKQG